MGVCMLEAGQAGVRRLWKYLPEISLSNERWSLPTMSSPLVSLATSRVSIRHDASPSQQRFLSVAVPVNLKIYARELRQLEIPSWFLLTG